MAWFGRCPGSIECYVSALAYIDRLPQKDLKVAAKSSLIGGKSSLFRARVGCNHPFWWCKISPPQYLSKYLGISWDILITSHLRTAARAISECWRDHPVR